MSDLPDLTPEERDRYTWQMWSPDLGEAGQRRLKQATVLVSRIGGVGGAVAMNLAAAGVGKLLLAHAGPLRRNDLNRQLLMSTADIGSPRIDSAARRLREINPHVAIETVDENVTADNAARLVADADVVVSAAPLFAERLAMNLAAVRQGKPLVDCAMYDSEGRLLTIAPGRTACLACLYPEHPPYWKREFPVVGAVASTVGALAAMETIQLIAQGQSALEGHWLTFDLRTMDFLKIATARRAGCAVCGDAPEPTGFKREERPTDAE